MIDDREVHNTYALAKILFYGGFVIITSLTAWITAYRMRKRMRKALGKHVSEAELTSINAWMKVTESERNTKEGQHGGSLGPPL